MGRQRVNTPGVIHLLLPVGPVWCLTSPPSSGRYPVLRLIGGEVFQCQRSFDWVLAATRDSLIIESEGTFKASGYLETIRRGSPDLLAAAFVEHSKRLVETEPQSE